MLLWLQSLGVDLDKIRIKLFVHMHLITSKLIWTRMCERFPNDAKKVLYVFLSPFAGSPSRVCPRPRN